MKIYMNTGVGRPCYFIPIKPMHRSSRIEAHGRTGIGITYWNGEWKVEETSYYNKSIKEFPVVGEIDLKRVLLDAVLVATINYEVKNGTD